MNGLVLVIGPIDKNTNKLSFFLLPMPIYINRQAWDKAYNAEAGYANIYPTPIKTKTNCQHFCGYEMEVPETP